MNLEAIPLQPVYLAGKGRSTPSLGRPLASSCVALVITALQEDKATKPQRVHRVHSEQHRHWVRLTSRDVLDHHHDHVLKVRDGTGNLTACARSVLLEHPVKMQETVECVLQARSKTKMVNRTALQAVLRTHRASFCRVV